MSNKQALHEFQSRLATRLQTVQATGSMASWLAVEVDERRLLFPLSHAGEIFSWTQPVKVPYTHGWFLGVANLRGGRPAWWIWRRSLPDVRGGGAVKTSCRNAAW